MATTPTDYGAYTSNGIRYHNTQAYAVGLQQAIAAQNGGKTLELSVIYAWLSHEGQSGSRANDTNPLNIGPGASYSSIPAGLNATASLLLHGPYAGIRYVMAPAGQGNAVAQATAIESSPWDQLHYGAHGTITGENTITSNYSPGALNSAVQRIISVAGAGPSWINGAGAGGGVTSSGGQGSGAGAGATGTAAGTTLDQLLTKLGGGADIVRPTDTLTQSDLTELQTLVNGDGSLFLTGLPSDTKAQAQAWVSTLKVGQTLGSITVPTNVYQAITGSVPAGGGFVGVGPTNPQTGATDFGAIGAGIVNALTTALAPGATFMYVGCIIVGGILAFKGYTALAAGPNPVV